MHDSASLITFKETVS